MEVYRNKNSNLWFIYIEHTRNEVALFVTAEALIKTVKLDLFDEMEEQEETYLLENKIITEDQVRRFHEYINNRSDDPVERIIISFEEMTPSEKERFLQKIKEMNNDLKRAN